MNHLELINIVKNCFGVKYLHEDEENYFFSSKAVVDGDYTDVESFLPKHRMSDLQSSLYSFEKFTNSITKSGYFECIVKNDSYSGIEGTRLSTISDDDTKYEVGDPSIELLFYALKTLNDGVGRSSMNSFPNTLKLNTRFISQYEKPYAFLDQILFMSYQIVSVKVVNPGLDQSLLSQLAQSFLYKINSSFGEAYSTVNVSIYDVFRSNQHFGITQLRYNEFKSPEKIYNQSILSYYQRAMSTNNVEFQYLSFYQIIEYFYDKLFIDKMTRGITEDYRNHTVDLNSTANTRMLIEAILKNYDKQNELKSLKYVLKETLPTKEGLKQIIESVDDQILVYLKNPWEGFLEFDKFDFDDLSDEDVINKLANRIYKLRNEITHRKSQRSKYIPQIHERYLLYETRLLQLIAEMVIDKSGKTYRKLD